MHAPAFSSLPTRRHFLRTFGHGFAGAALASVTPRLFARESADAPRALVLVQLEGGNDWFNTLAPTTHDDYRRARPTLALRPRDGIALGDYTLHPAACALEPLAKEGQLRVLPHVGLAAPCESHFRATEIWQTASEPNEILATGWAGRAFDALTQQNRPTLAWHGTKLRPRLFVRASDRSRFAPDDETRRSLTNAGIDLGAQFREIAERASASRAEEFYFIAAPGFDTHAQQSDVHAARLHSVAEGIAHLQTRLRARGVANRVLTIVFSEFGRSLDENAQGGTDHGATGHVWLIGSALPRSRVPSLAFDAAASIDFRRVIASVLSDWLRVDADAVLGHSTASLPLFRSSSLFRLS